ncbi:NeuD/PglB/VioB family sugar acetyltransferase [Idiomarina xiamenensis]|uniref:Hexapeptide repeat-containing transferase n=1 Tax=Idiomarina xiamenensis 10-D-4 TaxID=740709 RepID=K2KBP2_9GAMM|nr:NeuD/PglB/VioB family sugar acetyltransferase [Idiomarina xiamenensis]EKE85203.1 hexapeptide repeat-containing transferase [Idiomarina xiamenensis 10-D-4]
MQRQKLVIVGAGGHAVSVANVADSAGYQVVAFSDERRVGERLLGLPVLSQADCLTLHSQACYVVAIGDNAVRERVTRELLQRLSLEQFPALVHHSAVISSAVSLAAGTVVMPQACIGPQSSLGQFCIVNSQALLDHDGEMADFSSLAPGVKTGGKVTVGRSSAVGIGAVIKHGVEIAHDVVIGAASYVHHDVVAEVVCYGSPARVVRPRQHGDDYL